MATQLSGCLTADGELAADGTGTLTLTYQAGPGATAASERLRVEAAGITVDSVTLAGGMITAKLRVANLAALSKTILLKDTAVALVSDGAAQKLTIKSRVPGNLKKPDDASIPGPKVRLTLPGKVLDANEHGLVDGKTVQWSFPLRTWLDRASWELVARFEGAAAADKPAGEKPASSPPAEGKPADPMPGNDKPAAKAD
jgi:hypothetical protein